MFGRCAVTIASDWEVLVVYSFNYITSRALSYWLPSLSSRQMSSFKKINTNIQSLLKWSLINASHRRRYFLLLNKSLINNTFLLPMVLDVYFVWLNFLVFIYYHNISNQKLICIIWRVSDKILTCTTFTIIIILWIYFKIFICKYSFR